MSIFTVVKTDRKRKSPLDDTAYRRSYRHAINWPRFPRVLWRHSSSISCHLRLTENFCCAERSPGVVLASGGVEDRKWHYHSIQRPPFNSGLLTSCVYLFPFKELINIFFWASNCLWGIFCDCWGILLCPFVAEERPCVEPRRWCHLKCPYDAWFGRYRHL